MPMAAGPGAVAMAAMVSPSGSTAQPAVRRLAIRASSSVRWLVM
jgi:hypothetical protein